MHNFYSDPTVAPYSHYIKKQVLKNETDSEYESLHTYEYTKSGKLLSLYGKYAKKDILDTRLEFDYENKKFNFYNPVSEINIIGGNLILDDNDNFIKLEGVNNRTVFDNDVKYNEVNTFENGKLILSIVEIGESKNKVQIHWQDSKVVKIESHLDNIDHLKIYTETNYSYNQDNQLMKSVSQTFLQDNLVSSTEMQFSHYKQYGDWTQAITYIKNQSSEDKIITTREIEYW